MAMKIDIDVESKNVLITLDYETTLKVVRHLKDNGHPVLPQLHAVASFIEFMEKIYGAGNLGNDNGGRKNEI